jgi:tetrahydromethanopterin S-methyltransferase subunit C
MSTVVFGILSMYFFKADLYVSCVTIVLGLIAWAYAYLAYWKEVKDSGVVILKTGLIPAKEEGQ